MKNFRFAILFMACVLPICALSQGKQSTKRANLVIQTHVDALVAITTDADSVAYADKLMIYGYDKAIGDRNETFYLENKTPFRISKVVVRFTYTNESGDMLHEQTYDIPCDIPSGETRQLAVQSFDTKHNHYYYKSRKPRRDAIPYRVTYTIMRYDVAIQLR